MEKQIKIDIEMVVLPVIYCEDPSCDEKRKQFKFSKIGLLSEDLSTVVV